VIHVREVEDRDLIQALSLEVDAGEAGAIALAIEANADLLLMDERRGRLAATRLGRRVGGVVGVVVEAKAAGLIPAVRPILDALTREVGFSDQFRSLREGARSRWRVEAPYLALQPTCSARRGAAERGDGATACGRAMIMYVLRTVI
jgi:hypothetical protein